VTQFTPLAVYDPNIWRALPVVEYEPGNLFTPHVKQEYMWTGRSVGGYAVHMRVTLTAQNPRRPDVYAASAVFMDDVYFVPDWVNLADLTEATS
jgi:hypothetical protein